MKRTIAIKLQMYINDILNMNFRFTFMYEIKDKVFKNIII